MTQVDIADLDVVFLTYDEANKEDSWIDIQNMIPWAVRVDGVKGSDAAHKAAAAASATDRFILIDGDNVPNAAFFNEILTLDDSNKDHVFRWRARNNINALMYGNGGLSCWTKEFIYNMRTHEASDGSADTAVEFCFDPKYIAMHNVYSTTYPNSSAYHAWRAGFREGVKMCLDRGSRISVDEFQHRVKGQNFNSLRIWHTIGRDVEWGEDAILGARMGTAMTMLQDWDHVNVQSFDYLRELWNEEVAGINIERRCAELASELNRRLDLNITEFDAAQSKFFKQCLAATHVQKSVMTTEQQFQSKQ